MKTDDPFAPPAAEVTRPADLDDDLGLDLRARPTIVDTYTWDEPPDLAAGWRRLLATTIDLGGGGYLLALCLPLFRSLQPGSESWAGYPSLALALAVPIGIQILVYLRRPGQTVGRALLGIQLRSEDGSTPSIWVGLLLREGLKLLAMNVLVVALWLRARDGRMVYESWSKTWVVRRARATG